MFHFLWVFSVCYNMCDSGWGFWPLTGLSPTSGTSLKAAAADRDIDKTLPCSGRKMSPPTSPHIPPRPGDLQPHPRPTGPQPASWAPSPCQETTNTNPFPEGRSQNQLLGVVFTNKAVLWGLRIRLGVESQQNIWCTPNIMASALGNSGNHLGNAGLQRGLFKIRLLLVRVAASWCPHKKTAAFSNSKNQVGFYNFPWEKTEIRWQTDTT